MCAHRLAAVVSGRRSLILGALLTIELFCGFQCGPARNAFTNATHQNITLAYTSTVLAVARPVTLPPGGGLQMAGDDGVLLDLRVTFASGQKLHLSHHDLTSLESALPASQGVWWITDGKVEYISADQSLIRYKRMFGHW
jgi:hypothetical protein